LAIGRRVNKQRSGGTPRTNVDRLISAGGSSAGEEPEPAKPFDVLLRLAPGQNERIIEVLKQFPVKRPRNQYLIEAIEEILQRDEKRFGLR